MIPTDRHDERLDALRARLERLEAELASLKAEVVALRVAAASGRGHPVPKQQAWVENGTGRSDAPIMSASRQVSDSPRTTAAASVTRRSTPAEKIALFRARFCGRDDAYALPWVSQKTGRKGWSPAVRSGYSTDRDTDRDFLPLTDAVLAAHLRGDMAGRRECHVGLYPVRMDDTCCLLACDFDDGGWQADAAAYADACRGAGIEVLAEISRSGEGAHVWMFFDAPVPAASARAVGTAMLREASARRAALRLDSYDRLFPAQDTLPTRSPGRQRLGNLIALPLYGRARAANRCVFADVHTWVPYDDQFAALAMVRPVPAAAVLAIAQAPTAGSTAGPEMPLRPRRGALRAARADVAGRHIAVTRDAVVHIPTTGMPPAVVSALKHAACLSNPEFYRKQAQRFSTFGTPRLVICFEQDTTELRLPRGLADKASEILDAAGFRVTTSTVPPALSNLDIRFTGTLRDGQAAAAAAMLDHETGVLVAPPGSGKTVVACALIAARHTPAAILVNRAELAAQWRRRLAEFLTIAEREIGQLGAGRRKLHGRVDVMMLPTLARRDDVQELLSGYGQVIVDECHNVAAPAVNAALRDVSVRNWVGLTATPFRADRLDGLITMQCGPIRHTMPPVATGDRRIVVHETDFALDDPSTPIQDVYSQLTANATRNTMIVTAVTAAAARGRRCLVLTNRRTHLDTLTHELRATTDADVIALHGGLSKTQRTSVMRQLSSLADEGHAFVLVAIDKVAGEGLDVSALDTVFLTVPVSFKGRIIQQVGRATRGTSGNDHSAVVHDFHDAHVPVLDRMFQRRHGVIAREGFVAADPR